MNTLFENCTKKDPIFCEFTDFTEERTLTERTLAERTLAERTLTEQRTNCLDRKVF